MVSELHDQCSSNPGKFIYALALARAWKDFLDIYPFLDNSERSSDSMWSLVKRRKYKSS